MHECNADLLFYINKRADLGWFTQRESLILPSGWLRGEVLRNRNYVAWPNENPNWHKNS